MSHSGGYNVYELLEDKVVWHYLDRDDTDLPKDSSVVIVEGYLFHGMARLLYRGWIGEDNNNSIASVKRWAKVPDEIWQAYNNGYFDRFNTKRKFQSETEFNQFKDKSIHICYEDLPEGAEVVGDFDKSNPYSHYNATIYYKDNQYYLCDGCKEWVMD